MQDLGTLPNGSYSTAFAINNSENGGQIVGYANDSLDTRAFIYSGDGPMQDLGVFPDRYTRATGINDTGLIVGYYQYSSVHIGFLYDSTSGLVQTMGSETEAKDVNNEGQVVGFVRSYVGGSTNHAMLFSDGQRQDLNDLIDSSAGWTLTEANAINDNGWIVGTGKNASGQSHAFLLTPVPEPSTFVLFAVGSVGLLLGAWRRR
jgi:probable HAF family extracellular repeat protein